MIGVFLSQRASNAEKFPFDDVIIECKKNVTLVRQQCSYVFLALTHRFVLSRKRETGCFSFILPSTLSGMAASETIHNLRAPCL